MSVKAETIYPDKMTSADFWQGVKDSLVIMVGVVPFGITCGVMALSVGLTPLETILMSLAVFAGAAQFISITMLADGTAGWGIISLTTLLVNLRHLLMGASLAPYMLRLPSRLQALLSFGMADETYAVTISRAHKSGYSAAYQLGANSAGYVTWAVSTAAGVYIGGFIHDPLAWGLDFAMPATFLALLIPRLVDRTSLAVCAVAAVVAVLGALYLSGKWYIILACLVASMVGGWLERRNEDAR